MWKTLFYAKFHQGGLSIAQATPPQEHLTEPSIPMQPSSLKPESKAKAKGDLGSHKRPPTLITVWQRGDRSGDGSSMAGGWAWIRGRQPTEGSGPADLGGVQWVELGSGREGSSAQAASGRGGRDRAKGGAAAVLPGVGGPPLLLPY